jgi:hypothetical protein
MLTFGSGLNRARAAALAAGAALAIAAVPLTSAFADDGEGDRPEPRPAPEHHKPAPKPVVLTTGINQAACQAAVAALQTFITNDRPEDALEHQQAELERNDAAEEQTEAADLTEDQQEHAQSALLRQNVEKACEPQPAPPSMACTTAKSHLTAFNLTDRSEDKLEQPLPHIDEDDNTAAQTADQAEDQAENAQHHQLQAAVAQACEPEEHDDH